MQSIEDLNKVSLLDELATFSTSPALQGGDGTAAVRGFDSVFRHMARTPALLRRLLQAEFAFTGVVDASAVGGVKTAQAALLREPEWFSAAFVVPAFSDMASWTKRCVAERAKGHLVVALVPCRTNTAWFHENVLAVADEVRFIRGRLVFPGFASQSPLPDAIVVYDGRRAATGTAAPPRINLQTKRRDLGRVAVVSSFTEGQSVVAQPPAAQPPASGAYYRKARTRNQTAQAAAAAEVAAAAVGGGPSTPP